MTKKEKRSSEIFADENREIFQEKVKFGKFSTDGEHFSETGGKSETEGKCIIASGGMDAPAMTNSHAHTHTPTFILHGAWFAYIYLAYSYM